MSATQNTIDSQDSGSKYLTTDINGQLQIVEVTPYSTENNESPILPELNAETIDTQTKYIQVNTNKGLMHLDLLNLTLVRCQDGSESYQVMNDVESAQSEQSDAVTCVLQSTDNEVNEMEQFVVMDENNGSEDMMFSVDDVDENEDSKKILSPAEILERAKALQKAKVLLSKQQTQRRGRKRKCDLPSPQELLSSPNFKLYLYSCKLCNFKCNAVKEMTAHKAAEHSNASRARGGTGSAGSRAMTTLQCARCPYRAGSHSQLMRHVKDMHLKESDTAISLNTEEVEAADVLVCGACGFESSSKEVFRIHIEDEHGATTC